MSDYKLLKPQETKGFIEPIHLKSLPSQDSVYDIMKKRLTSHYSILSQPSVIANSLATKSISASEQIFEREKNSFAKLKETLLHDAVYVNKFIAIMDGKIVDSDYDRSALAERVYTKHGYVQLFIGKVTKQKRYRELPSPERVKM